MKFRLVPLTVVAVCCLALSACSTMHMPRIWPFYKKPKAGPEAVHELNIVNADGSPSSFPQYWKRNTLVIDLSGVSGSGGVAARLPEQTTWPVRVAVRVRPGSVQQIEIQGEERNVLPVAPEGSDLIDLQLASSVYTPKTAAIYISWGSMPVFVDAPPEPEAAGFVSPTEVPKTVTEPIPAQASPPPGN